MFKQYTTRTFQVMSLNHQFKYQGT